MPRFLILLLLLMAVLSPPTLGQPATVLPPRPVPFRFVTDQGKLLSAAEATSLENGLRRYADNTGTQVVVVTVPSLGGRAVDDYARSLGKSWGIGQRNKDNGLIILLGAEERQLTIQAGQGLRAAITPALTNRVITEQMMPSFKLGRYFTGLRAGLNTLLRAANPTSNPQKNQLPTAAAPMTGADAEALGSDVDPAPTPTPAPTPAPGTDPMASAPASEPFSPTAAVPAPAASASGLGIGALAIGALLIGGVLWLLVRLFRRRAAPATPPVTPGPAAAPDFLPNQPGRPAGGPARGPMGPSAPDFLNRPGGTGMGGSAMGGILMTGAAAAAGAYLGNRMASGQDTTPDSSQPGTGSPAPALAPETNAAAGSGGFPALDNSSAPAESAPDYFTDDAAPAEPDYFSSDDTSAYDDSASDDTGGGGFDDDNSNSGSW
ncbi:hypothetical protein GCM10022408_32590 [Hymenobacter fastidiosus]|uniref:TPM domain-containing protein n=1 Tax=Hymenobacter fastidiosus TaxID=486264 RepID=A0ABP7SUB8_9BACT